MQNINIRRYLFLLALCPVFLFNLAGPAQTTPPPLPDDGIAIIRLSTHEVILDVVARDRNQNPISDLTAGEFQVFELGKREDKTPHPILSMRMIDPHRDASHAGAKDSGFSISTGAICALNSTTHYEIAIQASPEPGFHQVLVRSTRPQVTLSFRHRYYVGLTADDAHPKSVKASAGDIALAEASCFHSSTPPTLAIRAHPLLVPGGNATRYAVLVRPESLAAIGLGGSNTRVQLDFGMCTFDATGGFAQYLHSSMDHQLNADELARTTSRGLVNLLEIPGAEPPPLARLVVRDRVTGNLGIVDVARPVTLAAQSDHDKALSRPVGSIRSFGVVTPRENTFCG
ncbi:MAG: hypothetical protein ABSH20_21375, partial [Tepidisphaeraceae bacterium]